MDLLHQLVVGAYGAYAAIVGAYLDLRARLDAHAREQRVLRENHVRHLEERLARLEQLVRRYHG
jgi:hypothetical protein